MAENTDETCEGCNMFNIGWYKRCSIVRAGKDKNCPCKICLVKMMCKTACKEYREYEKEIVIYG